jgi:hypothetical protein
MLDASQEYYNLGMLVGWSKQCCFFLPKFHQYVTQKNLQGPLQRNFLSIEFFFKYHHFFLTHALISVGQAKQH